MQCPECDKRMRCKDSRISFEGDRRRRNYTCTCGNRETTIEFMTGLNDADDWYEARVRVKRAIEGDADDLLSIAYRARDILMEV